MSDLKKNCHVALVGHDSLTDITFFKFINVNKLFITTGTNLPNNLFGKLFYLWQEALASLKPGYLGFHNLVLKM